MNVPPLSMYGVVDIWFYKSTYLDSVVADIDICFDIFVDLATLCNLPADCWKQELRGTAKLP